jgi:hypothetical protein
MMQDLNEWNCKVLYQYDITTAQMLRGTVVFSYDARLSVECTCTEHKIRVHFFIH